MNNQTQILVFGSDKTGAFLTPAAKKAKTLGSSSDITFGRSGKTYAIPVFEDGVPIEISEMEFFINVFTGIAKITPWNKYFVMNVGVESGGNSALDVAILFKESAKLDNVVFSDRLSIYTNILKRTSFPPRIKFNNTKDYLNKFRQIYHAIKNVKAEL